MLPTFQTNLRNNPQIHENLLLTFFLCLSLLDVSALASLRLAALRR
jgi:hypothetical protein